MAEGGYDYDPNKPLIPDVDNDDYDDDFDDDVVVDDDDDGFRKRLRAAARKALSATQPFEPGQASTPYQREMQTMQSEHTGMPCYAEISSSGGPATDEISARLKNLRTNKITGILDISEDIPNLDTIRQYDLLKTVPHNSMKKN